MSFGHPGSTGSGEAHRDTISEQNLPPLIAVSARTQLSADRDFDSWDVYDQVCSNLFDKTPFAFNKIFEWVERKEEFVRRAGFVMMATLAVHAKKVTDEDFKPFFPLIVKYATDERNFVKKAVNWALRQMGKRNSSLNETAIKTAQGILKLNSKSAKWIAADALRELESPAVQKRLNH